MEMVKAYDKSALLAALKAQGIEEGERVAKVLVVVLADWLRSSAKLSTEGLFGKLDDLAIIAVDHVEKLALEKLDLLDGKVDPAPVVESGEAVVVVPADPAPAAPAV